MKVLILIMSADVEPSIRNERTIFDTYVKYYNDNKNMFKHEYDFIAYKGNKTEVYKDNNILYLTSPDDIKNTFNKTIEAFNYIKDFEFDFIIRVNTSTYINMFILDSYIEEFNKDIIYCNMICTYYKSSLYHNEMFPRGDAYIIHKELFTNILNYYNTFNIYDVIDDGVDIADDSLFGIILSNYFNHQTHNHIKLLEYSFIPYTIDNLDTFLIKKGALVIFSRLKTVPIDEGYSGYSWDDNGYRLDDVKKFKILNSYIYNTKNVKSNIIFNNGADDKFVIDYDNSLHAISFNNLVNLLNMNTN